MSNEIRAVVNISHVPTYHALHGQIVPEDSALSFWVEVQIGVNLHKEAKDGEEIDVTIRTEAGVVKVSGTVKPDAVRDRLVRELESAKSINSHIKGIDTSGVTVKRDIETSEVPSTAPVKGRLDSDINWELQQIIEQPVCESRLPSEDIELNIVTVNGVVRITGRTNSVMLHARLLQLVEKARKHVEGVKSIDVSGVAHP